MRTATTAEAGGPPRSGIGGSPVRPRTRSRKTAVAERALRPASSGEAAVRDRTYALTVRRSSHPGAQPTFGPMYRSRRSNVPARSPATGRPRAAGSAEVAGYVEDEVGQPARRLIDETD